MVVDPDFDEEARGEKVSEVHDPDLAREDEGTGVGVCPPTKPLGAPLGRKDASMDAARRHDEHHVLRRVPARGHVDRARRFRRSRLH